MPPFVFADFLGQLLDFIAVYPVVTVALLTVLAIVSLELCLWVARVSARRADAEARARHLHAIARAQHELQSQRIHRLVSPHAGGKDAA